MGDNEDDFVRRLVQHIPACQPQTLVAAGDDCAVLTYNENHYWLSKTDAITAAVHFHLSDQAELVGSKAISRVISDIAAMGGTPHHFLVTIACTANIDLAWLELLYQGMQQRAQQFQADIVGGETNRLPGDGQQLLISIAGGGVVEKRALCLRSTAQIGDIIYVTGKLGNSYASGKHLTFMPQLAAARWLTSAGWARSMMDLSDGIGKDLPRLCLASNCGYQLDCDAIPRADNSTITQALYDGEDYQLLFTVAAHQQQAFQQAMGKQQITDYTAIGVIREQGYYQPRLNGGWDHLHSQPISQ